MTDQAIIDRANAAKRLKNSADFQLIAAAIENDIFSSFRLVSLGDNETLTNIHSLSHGFKLLNDRIAKYIELVEYERNKEQFSAE